MIQPVFLWSDILIFALVLAVVFFVWQLRHQPLTRQRWHSVFASRIGMSSFIIMMTYVLIALLDSLHYREALPATSTSDSAVISTTTTPTAYSNEVKSVLDWLLSDLTNTKETTYSAPFALYSFAKESQVSDDGQVQRVFPRLQHVAPHLLNDQQRIIDITAHSIKALFIGLLIALPLIGLHWLWRRSRGPSPLPWLTAYVTVTVIVVSTTWMIILSQHYHIFGTDKIGTDVLYQSIKSIRTGILIGTLATLLALPLAIILGISAGYFRGWIDDAVQYLYTTLSSIPGILLIAASVLLIDVYIETNAEEFALTALRADFKFLALCAILGLTSWTGLCRLLRAETLKVSQLDYVQAAHAFGVSHQRIIGRHILPNVTHIVLIALVLDFSAFVLAEAVLSYIGVGVDASMHSWGNMINAARSELSRDPFIWWPVLSAFIFMFVLVLAANLFADEVRHAFDPHSVKEPRV